ncbi:serine O-acetyltransferase [Buttiauxella sp. A111]|uniref:serine O-acetyltransferase n=1 Tax=Buttiauxella sp. A111 TaxID=2563088 RepID=UPI0010DCF104|nr:serine acetyltransferase [Buttiauxella sp. A111]GDX04562.1 serine acetyltransferase [Buttiauxella sp. A111]
MKNIKKDIQRYKSLIGDNSEFKFKNYFKIFNPRLIPNVLYRSAYYFNKKGLRRFSKIFSFINVVVFNVEIATECEIKGGLFMPHTFGIVIGAARIGENFTVYQNVTIGAKNLDMHYDRKNRPVIEDNVVISTGAVVIGAIILKNGSKVAANAVVIKDVEANELVGGMPAKRLKLN